MADFNTPQDFLNWVDDPANDGKPLYSYNVQETEIIQLDIKNDFNRINVDKPLNSHTIGIGVTQYDLNKLYIDPAQLMAVLGW